VAQQANKAKPVSAEVARLLDQFHRRRPVRAWSLIVTLYGDAIAPRGGSLWLGSLTDIMALFRIDAGHVRTAMSRLTADGWLERVKIKRNSYYRLSRREHGSFMVATQRIYFAHEPAFDGRLRVALLGPDRRPALRGALEQAGFVTLTPAVYVAWSKPAKPLPAGVFLLTADADAQAGAVAQVAWKLAPIAEAYRAFIARFTPLDTALAGGATLTQADALVARTLLIHEFRRVLLRDPGLPAALLQPDWPGLPARALTARIYLRIVAEAEHFLGANAQQQAGPLPLPTADFAGRFGA
jgi:phenylacetic acid degradation operon negative regulatory protein